MIPEIILNTAIFDTKSTFPRWIVENFDGHVWDGKTFAKEKTKAVLYASEDMAAKSIHRILKKHYVDKDTSRTTFVLPVFVNVYGDEKLTKEELLDYLCKALKIEVDYHTAGNGPNGNLVLSKVEWDAIKKLKNK